MVRCIA